MDQNLVLRIEELGKEHVTIAGGKGANLGELSKKVHVPNGFVVLNSSFKKFLLYNNLLSTLQQFQKQPSLELTVKISKKILKAQFPKLLEIEILEGLYPFKKKFFAVRSSAIFEDSKEASWAGQLETITNVKKHEILENIKKCWSSLFSERSINYFKDQKINKTWKWQ